MLSIHTLAVIPYSISHRRKRQLSDGDPDAYDFMPLSKRINNLHLNGSNLNSESTPTFSTVSSFVHKEFKFKPIILHLFSLAYCIFHV